MIVALLPLFVPAQNANLDLVLNDPKLAGSVVAAYAVDMEGNTLYERNADLRVMPASNQKILTAAFALHKLGPDYRPATRIWTEKGRTVIHSPGDPSLTFAQLKEIAKGVHGRKPVTLVQAFRRQIPGGWEHDDLPNRYAAQVSAFSFDQGAFALWSVGGKPVLLPDAFGVRIRWTAKTGPVRVAYDPFGRVVEVSGAMPKAKTRLDTLALPSPDLDAASLFGKPILNGSEVPAGAPSRSIQGDPIRKQIADCLQPSDNLRAENLFLMAGGPTYARAQTSMSAFLTDTVQVPTGAIRPHDGSGLSRHNVVTARGLSTVLLWADRQPTRDLWREALAGPGRPGTLRARLTGLRFAGKTGSLDMVSALSGYLETPGGKKAVVSLVLNHFLCSATESRQIMDKFVQTLQVELDAPKP